MSTNSLPDDQISNPIAEFKIDAKIASVRLFAYGHINGTYRVVNADAHGNDYLLQPIDPALVKKLEDNLDLLKQVIKNIWQSFKL